jgi:LysM repeat protein
MTAARSFGGVLRIVLASMFLFCASTVKAQVLVTVPCVLIEGETIAEVAVRFGVTPDDLAELNRDTNLSDASVGTEIAVGIGERVEHTVARGETMLRLARRYGVTATDLGRWNSITDARRLRAGARLVIYAWPHLPPSSSIGRPSAGSLEHAVRLRSSPSCVVHDRERAFVTREVATALDAGLRAVREAFPRTPRIEIRDASIEHGGPLAGHHSHQSGRDIDVAYYRHHCDELCAHGRVEPGDLDAERLYSLLVGWLRSGALDYVFIDYDLQGPLYRAAQAHGATYGELARWFQWPHGRDRQAGIIRHASGHRDHMHLRFACGSHDRECRPDRSGTELP